MCRLATGGGISGRSLYTNADEFVYFLKRPQITTGIPKFADRADFAAQWIQITMPRIPRETPVGRGIRSEGGRTAAAHSRPVVDRVSGILANPDEKPDHLLRKADFAVWIARARPVLGWHPSKFAEAYEMNRGSAGDAVIDADVLAQAIIDLLEQEHGYWEGTATDLIAALPVSEKMRNQKGFPAPSKLPEQLTRLQNTFAGEVIEIAFMRANDQGRKRLIVLTRRDPQRLSQGGRAAAVSLWHRFTKASPRPFEA